MSATKTAKAPRKSTTTIPEALMAQQVADTTTFIAAQTETADEALDADQQALDAACAVLDQAAAEELLDAEPAPATTLTPMQRTVLLAFPGGASAEGDNGASWTEVADLATATGLTKRQVMGVLSSLSTKGLIYADEEKANGEAGTLQCLTDEGARLVGMLTAEPVAGGEVASAPASSWETCRSEADVLAFAAIALPGQKLVPKDTAQLIAGFPGCHKNLRSFSHYHFVRFPKATPQEGTFICFTGPKHGAIVVVDGKPQGELAGKSIPVVALFKAEEV